MMRRSIPLFCALSLAACGGGDDGFEPTAGNPGFAVPETVTTAFTEEGGVFTEIGPANWSCLGTPTADTPSATTITLSGTVEDFQTGDEVADAEVTVFADVKNLAGAGDDQGIAGADGGYTVTLPAGAERAAFKVSARGALDTYSLNQAIDPQAAEQTLDVRSVSQLTANALPAFIGVSRTPGLGVIAGAIRDCDGNEVSGAIATVSELAGSPEHLDGAATYYFSADSTDSLPVRHRVQPATNKDGLFTVIELAPAASAYIQVWGFTADQDPATDSMTLLGESPSPIFADSVVISSLDPIRTP